MSRLIKKLDLSQILFDEVTSIKNSSSARTASLDTFLFFLIPLVISSILIWRSIYINEGFKGLLINAYSIFAGLLFGLQVFIFDIVSRVRELQVTAQAAKQKIAKIKYLSNNVSFEILVSLFGALILLASSMFPAGQEITNAIFSFASFYLFILFLLLLILILKAVHILLLEEIKYQEKRIEE